MRRNTTGSAKRSPKRNSRKFDQTAGFLRDFTLLSAFVRMMLSIISDLGFIGARITVRGHVASEVLLGSIDHMDGIVSAELVWTD